MVSARPTKKGSQQLHVVYASPGTIAAYRKDGHFPDGSVLVKEVFETATGPMTSGTVSSARRPKPTPFWHLTLNRSFRAERKTIRMECRRL